MNKTMTPPLISVLNSKVYKTFKQSFYIIFAAAFLMSGFFAPSLALAAHTATVTVSPTLVKGNQSSTYTFNITNNGADAIYRVIVAIPSGFTSIASASCPTGMTASEVSSTQVICLGDSFEAGTQIANGTSAQVSFSATSPTPGSDTLYTWSVTTRDTTGASVVNTSAQTNVDVTVPTIQSITTKDANGDGTVDTATIVFSEPVLDSSFAVAGNFNIGGSPGTSISSGTADDNTFDVLVLGGVAGTKAKDVTYTQGTGADMVGNLLANVVTGTIAEVDGAAPVFMSARTTSPTTITATFSEDLDGNTVTNADFSVTGLTLTTPDATDTNTPGVVHLTVSTPFSTGETPAVTYNTTVSNGVKDSANNQAPAAGPITPTDGIAPTFTAVRTGLNTIVLTFSENVDVATTGGSGYTLSAGTVTANTDPEGVTNIITLTTSGLTGTSETPTVTYGATAGTTVDVATNEVVNGASAVASDNVAPIISSTAPATNAFIKTQTVSYTLSEAVAATSGVITFTQTGGSADSNSPHTCVLQGTALNSGAHTDLTLATDANVCVSWANPLVSSSIYTVTFNASDAVSNPATAVTNTGVTFDNVVPTLVTVTILSNNTVPTLAKVGDTITLTIVASENLTSTPTVTITGDAVTTTGSGVNWTATYTMVSGDSEGVVPFTIDFTDIATNAGVQVIATTNASSVTFDKTAPTAPTIGAFTATGGTAVAAYINSTNTGFTVTFTSPAANFAGIAHLYVGGVEFATPVMVAVGAASTLYTLTGDATSITDLGADGARALTVVIVDAAGNTSVASASSGITKDTAVPAAVFSAATDDVGTITGPMTSGQTTDDTALVLSGTNESGSTVQVFNGINSLAPAIVSGTTWSYTATVANGTTYLFNVKETDVAGNISPATANFTVIGDTSAPSTPSITLIATDEKINDAEKGAIVVVGTAEANALVNVSLTSGATVSGTQQLVGGATAYSVTIDGTTLTDGTVTPSVTATDAAGNVSSAATTPTAVKDVGVPSAPTTPDLATASDSNITTDNITIVTTPTFTGTAESGSTVTVYDTDGTTVIGTGVATGGNYSVVVSTLSAGDHSITAKATDVVGNTSSASSALSVTIDTTAPTSTISSPSANAVVKDAGGNVSLGFTSTGGSVCEYKVGVGAYQAISCTSPQTITLTDGRNSIILRVTDTAGNSTESSAVSFVVDTNDNLTVASSGADFTTIQGAVTASTANDTINVAAGTYSEAVTINKSLTLTGTGSPTVTSFTLTNGAVVSGSSGITASNVYVNQTGATGAKIQDGVLLASSGGTVTVGAGTYTGEITVSKSLTINGANVGVAGSGTRGAESIIDGNDVTNPVDKGFIVSAGNLVVTIDGFMFTDNSPLHDNYASGAPRTTDITFRNNIVSSGNALQTTDPTSNWRDVIVTRNKFENIDMESIASAVDLNYNRSSVVTDNVFSNISYAAIQVFSNDTATISGNTITTTGKKGIQLAGAMGASSTVSNNVISGANSSSSADYGGIRLYGADFTGTVNVTGNTVSGSFNGIAIKDGQNITGKDINVNNNNLADNANKSVYHGGTGTLDATKNWYGTADGTTIASKISGTVDYRPWYLSLADLNSSTIDQVAPTVALTYSANPAKAGSMTITATYSEAIAGTPQISVNQQGATNVSNATMSGSGAVWTYAYTVNTATGGTYIDGTATVSLSSVNDPSGNIAGSPTGTTFTIDTTAPNAPIITSIATDDKINDSEKTAIVVIGTAVADSLVTVSLTNGVTVTGTQQLSGGATAYSITINGTTLNEGTVTPSVTATDTSGNVSSPAITPTALKDTIAPAFTINDGTATGPVKTDTINLTVTEVNLDTSTRGFSADNICNASDTIATGFTSGADFSITGDYTTYLCAKATDTSGNETYQLVGQLNTDNTNPALVLGSLFTGQTLNGGLSYSINWTASDINFSGTPIKLEYSIDDGSTWTTIIASTEDDGVYNWSVPTSINSSSAKIKITATDTATNSNSAPSGTFTIVYVSDTTPPVVTLNSPNGAESWVGGSSHVITWTATDNVTAAGSLTVKLEYSTNGSTSWTTIIASTDNDGAYLWTVPDSASTNMLVKVTATDAATNAGSDLSNAVFTITAQPSASICSGVGGENWTCIITLSTGWNLVSLPVIISNTAIATVLSGVVNNMDLVQYWNGSAWVTYKPSVTLDLATIEDGKGYWIKMTGSDTLNVTGTKAPAAPDHAPTYSVASGWNLVGFKSTISQLTSTYLSNLSTISYTLLNASNENKNSGNMDSSKGYWLWAGSAGTIITSSETE